MRALSLLLLLSTLLLQGCQYDPYAHLYTTEKPKPEDLVGAYTLLRQTVDEQHPSALQGKPCLIELHADGTFIASNVPPWTIGEPATNFFDTLISDTGSWRLDTTGTVNGTHPKPDPIWGIYLDSANSKIAPIHIAGTKAPFGLVFTLGDPDSGQAMLFTKQFSPGTPDDQSIDPFTLDEISDGIPGISWFLILVLIICAFFVMIVALAVTAIVAFGITILVGLGIISSSVFFGFLRRSPASGFRALFLQLGAIAGIACGIGAVWLVSWAAHAHWNPACKILLGGTSGLLCGLLAALLFNFLWGRAATWLLNRCTTHKI
ncbi:hypothetical protein [Pedosphaera parvula]|uniref:Lipoprotein n=1 Tax=Pedosphaera parvula (strain Ellin514) TaxID=320771 RepID=B9XRX1_PEDPL|nr:hypothetical protein [Pedosphaera parvula]EEF57430.1 hypothetical protein Cflav_PD0275 [Pedosphaera parvula Ellin514]